MKSILLALQFLTRLSIRIKAVEPTDLARSMAWFPLVGLFIGLFLGLVNLEAMIFNLTPEITAGLLVLALIIITGGLHLDGLADTADGFYAGGAKRSPDESRDKTRERILNIMHDSHTGAMGVIAIVVVLLLKYAILVSLLTKCGMRNGECGMGYFNSALRTPQFAVLVVVPMLSRWGMVVAAALLPPAKSEGLGQSFLFRLKPGQWIIATFITGLVTIGLLKTDGFILYLVSLFLVMLSISYIKPKLGGLTGDTLGAINEVLEVGGFFTAYLLFR